jgi:general secretion pathway protein E
MSSPRKPAPSAARTAPAPDSNFDILPMLVSRRVVTPEQAEKVRRAIKMNNLTNEQALTQLGVASEVQIAQALAAHTGLRYVKLNPLDLDLDVVTKALSGPFARKHGMVAISKTATTITIAIHDPFQAFPEEDVKRVTGLDVEKVLATKSDVETINKGFYDLKTSLQTAEKQLNASRVSNVDLTNQEFLSSETTELDPAAAPVVRALDHILNYAFEQRASDIHFEPKRELTLVRLRIDGMLHDVHLIPRIVYQAVVSRIKLLSGCNLAEKRRPQDGRIKRENAGREVELRVSTMPTAFGEKVVMRIFDPDILLKGIDDLGLAAHDLPKFYDFIARPTGIILVTGPTGSGKTTTLYSVLKHLSKPEVNIITIEDPIEMVFEDFNQVAVRPQIDITFSSTLRTVLRQDPDIIMVGEIRDQETAEHAVQAALTGHLVLSTLHTNDAPSSITRLLDLNIPHFLITSTLIGILAQRLVRENCKHCIEEYSPTVEEAKALRMDPEKLKPYRFKRGKGCLHCRDTGYTGRIGIFETLPMSEKVRSLVTAGAGSPDLFKAAREEGMRTLRESAVEKVFRGITTVTEMIRVTGK